MNKLRGIHPLLLFYFAVLPNLQAVKILLENGRWGNVQSQEIQLVLESTASVFSPYAPILIKKKYLSPLPLIQEFITSEP